MFTVWVAVTFCSSDVTGGSGIDQSKLKYHYHSSNRNKEIAKKWSDLEIEMASSLWLFVVATTNLLLIVVPPAQCKIVSGTISTDKVIYVGI